MKMNNHLDLDTAKHLEITLIRSASGRFPKHKATLNALGLRRIGQSVRKVNNKATLGMVRSISYLIQVEVE